MKQRTVALLFLLLSCKGFGQDTNSDYRDILPVIDIWLDAQKDFDRLPGLSVAIVHDQDILFAKGYGYADVEKEVPMKPETICSICSISKLFTSIAVMQLWEKGKIRLDDSLQFQLPAYKINQQYKGSVPVTVRSLLTHTSGLTRDADSSWNGPDFHFLTAAELKKSMVATETLYPASSYFQYSNLGMSLLGEIVAEKSGASYNDYVEQQILKPLQLNSTHPYLPHKLWRNEMAAGYNALSRQGKRTMQPFFETNAITPAAGFSSNVIDMAKFASWQFRLLSSGATEILKSSTLKEMQRIQWISPDKKLTWGFGFHIEYQNNGTVTVGHDGSCPGYVSVLMIDPKTKLGVTIMVNAQGVDVYKYSDQIFSLLNKKISADSAAASINLSEYKGSYDSYIWWGEDVIVPYKGKLIMFGVPNNTPADGIKEYQYIKKDLFRLIRPDDKTLGEELVFARDENGKIVSARTFSRFMKKLN